MNKLLFSLLSLFIATTVHSQDHKVGEELSSDLDGTIFTYEYELGNHYELWLENGHLRYRRTNKPGDEAWRDRVPYYARKLHDGEYFIGWKQPERENFVSLVINLNTNDIYSSAILVGYDFVHFQNARITSVRQE